ncbi:MAG: gamma-glutamylcyclotransferase [Planctomycetaceae bacterium]|nr:gamma-glutamylcyclotransferase [Planctomycetaceae bacterium]
MNGDRWYFAYGSNLFIDQKEQRTGHIRQQIRCRLPGFRFAFNKRGGRGQVFANIVPDDSAEVWGVAYLCDPKAMRLMDCHEGVAGGHYERVSVTVVRDGGEKMAAISYVAGEDYVCEAGRPCPKYLRKIIIGARQHALPEEYIAQIERLAE